MKYCPLQLPKHLLIGSLVVSSIVLSSQARELPSPKGEFIKEQPSKSQEARVVFYRVNGDDKNIATVKIDDKVIGALSPGHYTQASACSGMIRVGVADRWAVVDTTHYLEAVKAESSQDIYFKVDETADGHFSISQTDMQTAQSALSSLKLGSNIINRYVPKCVAPAPEVAAPAVVAAPVPEVVAPVAQTPAKPVVFKTINLGADALFPFDSSHFKPEGRIKLDNFVQEIQSNNLQIEKLRITGHTDRLGDAAYNQNLSKQRAQRVADYFKEKGLAVPMETVGKGKTEPITIGCKGGGLSNKQLKDCLQPDRRVGIELIGYEAPSIEIK